MHARILSAAACLLLVPTALSAPALAQKAAPAPAVKIDKTKLDKTLADFVASGRATGASALVWKDGREVYFGATGLADREANRPYARDTLVQIFSMTKPVTGVALMQLWEQGKFGLDDPLSDYLPEFAHTKVYLGNDAAGKPILRAPQRPILIRDVLRHTAGFGYGGGSDPVGTAYVAADPLNMQNDLTEFGRRLATVPLLFEPGTQWRYSAAVDVQALLVEKLSGQKFEAYVRQHILDPLGMKESGWTQPESAMARTAVGYAKGPNGLTRMPEEAQRRLNFSGAKLTMGGAGILAPIDDYMRFARMLLNKGSLDGVRILKPSTVKLMSTDQLDPRVKERHFLPGKGNGGFGFDFFVRTGQPKTPGENRGAIGEFYWDGAWSPLFWVDPANNLAAVLFVSTAPFDGTMHVDIRKAIYGADYLGPPGD
jgi:CubicO group peptidase (beta-lactamase class C family)